MTTEHTAESLQRAFRYLFEDEVPELKRLAQLLPPAPMVVNIGAGAGTSTLALLEARPDIMVISIDKQAEDSPLGCLSAERRVVQQAGMSDRLEQINQDSRKAGISWKDDLVDMVFIDGDHSLEGCAGDIVCWLRNLKPSGLMAVHDYRKIDLYEEERKYAPHPTPWLGVDMAVDLLLVLNFKKVGHAESLICFRIP
jgi:predicted O-methyltransferase YrrM